MRCFRAIFLICLSCVLAKTAWAQTVSNDHGCISEIGSAEFILERIQGYIHEYYDYEKVDETFTYTEIVPATYEWVTETILVHGQNEIRSRPPTFKWIDGEHPGETIVPVFVPAKYEWRDEVFITRPEYTVAADPNFVVQQDRVILMDENDSSPEWTYPAETETRKHKVVLEYGRVEERKIRNLIRNGKTYMVDRPGQVVEVLRPVQRGETIRRVVKTAAKRVERTIHKPVYKRVKKERRLEPDRFTLKRKNGERLISFDSYQEFLAFKSDLTCAEMRVLFSTNPGI